MSADQGKSITVTIRQDGTVESPWWTPEVEDLLRAVHQGGEVNPDIRTLVPFKDQEGRIMRLCG